MWIVQIQEHYLIFKTMKDIKREFPFLDKDRIYKLVSENGLELEGLEIINPKSKNSEEQLEFFAENYWKKRQVYSSSISAILIFPFSSQKPIWR